MVADLDSLQLTLHAVGTLRTTLSSKQPNQNPCRRRDSIDLHHTPYMSFPWMTNTQIQQSTGLTAYKDGMKWNHGGNLSICDQLQQTHMAKKLRWENPVLRSTKQTVRKAAATRPAKVIPYRDSKSCKTENGLLVKDGEKIQR